jgi:hypothetical protein
MVSSSYLCYLGVSIAVAVDPTGVGGVSSPDGLEGVGVVLSVIAFPFVVAAIAVSYVVVIRRRKFSEDDGVTGADTPSDRVV